MTVPEGAWRRAAQLLREDGRRLRLWQESKFGYRPLFWFVDPAWICVALHRCAHAFFLKRRQKSARLCMQLNSVLTGADLHPACDLGGGLLIPSPCGVNISAKAGANLTVLALGGIGGSVRDRDIGAGVGLPVLGPDVVLNWFSAVQGSVRIGDRVEIGPGAAAVVDVPPDSFVWSVRTPLVESRAEEAPPPIAKISDPPCRHLSFKATRADFIADVDRLRREFMAYMPDAGVPPSRLSAMTTNSLMALAVHRLAHWFYANEFCLPAKLLARLNYFFHKVTIPESACVGPGLLMPHLAGCILHGRAGKNLTFYADGLSTSEESAFLAPRGAAPQIGDDVLFAGNAGAFGPINIGSGAQLGPKAQAIEDLAPRHRVWNRLAHGSVVTSSAGAFAPEPTGDGSPEFQRLARNGAAVAHGS